MLKAMAFYESIFCTQATSKTKTQKMFTRKAFGFLVILKYLKVDKMAMDVKICVNGNER